MKKRCAKLTKLLITGSRGRIGKILTRSLGDTFNVYGLDIVGEEDKKFFLVDVADYTHLKKVFRTLGTVDSVIHLAAEIRFDAPWESYLTNNIIGTRNVYECARLYKVKKVIYASSNHVTGMYEGLPPTLHKKKNPQLVRVGDGPRPDGYYGLSKAVGELFARLYFDLYGIESLCLRIGTVRGNDDPTCDKRFMKTWLSHRDLVQLVKKSLSVVKPFGIYYGVSNNRGRFWDISNAERELHYHPRDDASLLDRRG